MAEDTKKSWQAWLPRLLARMRLREHQTFLGTSGLLPVVSRSDVRRLEGVVTLEDVLKVFSYARRS